MDALAKQAGAKGALLLLCAFASLVLFGFSRYVAQFQPTLIFVPAILLLFFLFLHLRFKYQLALLAVISYFPGHQLLVFIPVFLWLKEALYRGKVNFGAGEAIGLLFLIVSHIYNDGQSASFTFFLFCAWYWLFFYKWLDFHDIDDKLVLNFIHLIFFFQAIQLLIFIPDFIKTGANNIGDGYLGTMGGSNFYLAGKTILGFTLAAVFFKATGKKAYLVLFLIMLLTWLMMSLKMSVVVVMAVFGWNMLRGKGNLIIKIAAGAVGIAGLSVLMLFFDSDFGMLLWANEWLWEIGKLKVFADTWHFLSAHWDHLALGLGPGNFVSRTAMIISGGIDTNYSQYLPYVRLPFADMLVYPTFTKELLAATTGSILSTPNSSLFTLVTETGIFFSAYFFWRLFRFWKDLKRKAASFAPRSLPDRIFKACDFYFATLFLLCFLDYWLDYPTVILPFLVLISYLSKKKVADAPLPAPAVT